MECVQSAVDSILLHDPSFRCHCHSGCFQLNYDSTLSMARIFDNVPFLTRRGLDPKQVAILHAYYARSTFRAHKRHELVGFVDFLCKQFPYFYLKNKKT